MTVIASARASSANGSVLLNQVKATCLCPVFKQDITEDRAVCDLELVSYQEAVIQLLSNWFPIKSLSMFTSYIQCHSGTANEADMKQGVKNLFALNLCNHSMHSKTRFGDYITRLKQA